MSSRTRLKEDSAGLRNMETRRDIGGAKERDIQRNHLKDTNTFQKLTSKLYVKSSTRMKEKRRISDRRMGNGASECKSCSVNRMLIHSNGFQHNLRKRC